MNIYNCSFEIPYLNYITDSSIFRITNFSKCILNSSNLSLRSGASSCKGRFHLTDQTSIFKLNDTLIDREDFLNYKPYNYNIGDYNSFINRQILDVSSIENNRLSLKTRNSYNHITQNGFLFNKKN